MPAPMATVTTRPLPGADAEVMSTFYPVPGLGLVPINLFLLRAGEPVLVDTGPIYLREQVLAALEALIDLDDLRWIYLTHTDPDHVGCLRDVLARAPRARVVTTFVGLGKLGSPPVSGGGQTPRRLTGQTADSAPGALWPYWRPA